MVTYTTVKSKAQKSDYKKCSGVQCEMEIKSTIGQVWTYSGFTTINSWKEYSSLEYEKKSHISMLLKFSQFLAAIRWLAAIPFIL